MTEDDSKYEIVLWGATGFTGQFVAEYLAKQYDNTELRWAIAGRNPEKLENVRDHLAEINEDLATLDILTGDAFDKHSIDEIAEQTQVICTTVGPYAKYGSNVVDACVEHRTDYCDLAGEVHWIRRIIDKHHDTARERGVRVVHSCGFDSIPSDLGTLMIQNYAEENIGTSCSNVRTFASDVPLAPSGGSIASIVGMYEEIAQSSDVRRSVMNPYSLAPKGERDGPDTRVQRGPRYDRDIDQWTAPFLMAAINEKTVHRSNALLGYPWRRNFRYSEVIPTGPGLLGAVRATGIASGLAFISGTMLVSPLRKLVNQYILPDPGEGPDRETVEEGSFDVWLLGTGCLPESGSRFAVKGKVTANRDPGYGATSLMLAESAICLASAETDTPLNGGVLTPASGIGMPLIERLRDVGMTFTIDQKPTVERQRITSH